MAKQNKSKNQISENFLNLSKKRFNTDCTKNEFMLKK